MREVARMTRVKRDKKNKNGYLAGTGSGHEVGVFVVWLIKAENRMF